MKVFDANIELCSHLREATPASQLRDTACLFLPAVAVLPQTQHALPSMVSAVALDGLDRHAALRERAQRLGSGIHNVFRSVHIQDKACFASSFFGRQMQKGVGVLEISISTCSFRAFSIFQERNSATFLTRVSSLSFFMLCKCRDNVLAPRHALFDTPTPPDQDDNMCFHFMPDTYGTSKINTQIFLVPGPV